MSMTLEDAEARLAADPIDIEALVAKAAHEGAQGRERSAASFYRAALVAAGQKARSGPLPAALRAPIEQAQRALAEAEQGFAGRLLAKLAAEGFGNGQRPPRFEQSLELLMGRRSAELQLQRPTTYYYPGLPQKRYYERAELPWSAAVERHSAAILAELERFTASGGDGFSPYLASDPSRPRTGYHGLTDNPSWSTFYLTENGVPVPALEAAFPVTFAALSEAPLVKIGARAPSVLFSRLQAGAHIPPHHGMLNARLICHLPLVVPPGCGFRVADEVREWREGELLTFDDSIEHEAWNRGPADRTLLIFDIWRPELDEKERAAVDALFRILDQEA